MSPGVGKKDAVRKAVPHQQLGQFYLRPGVEEIAHVHQLAGLIADGPGHLRLAVAQDANRDPGQEIQIFLAVFIPEAAAFAPHHGGRKTSVGVNEHLLAPFYPFAVVHLVLSLQLCAKSFRSMPSQATSSVPMPVCVKISSKIACSWRPSMMCALLTPPFSAALQQLTLGIMPP